MSWAGTIVQGPKPYTLLEGDGFFEEAAWTFGGISPSVAYSSSKPIASRLAPFRACHWGLGVRGLGLRVFRV